MPPELQGSAQLEPLAQEQPALLAYKVLQASSAGLAPLVFKVQLAQALTVLLARLGSGSLVQPVPLELRGLVLQAPRGQQVLLAQMGLRAQLAPLVCLELQALLVQRE